MNTNPHFNKNEQSSKDNQSNKDKQVKQTRQARQTPDYTNPGYTKTGPGYTKKQNSAAGDQNGLSAVQQQFVLKFCRQLASVIQACEHSETAEIEIGRRHISAQQGTQQIRVKLQAMRELTKDSTPSQR